MARVDYLTRQQLNVMKKSFVLIFVVPWVVFLAISCQAQSRDAIKVFCWTLTPQAKAVISGLERVLGRSLPVVDAGGDYANGEILIKQLAEEKLQLLVVLGTQALALTAPKVKKTLVVFAMVADPYHTRAAYNKAHPEDHQGNIIGIASPPPLDDAIRQTQKFFPAKRHWGLLYNPSEGSSIELKQNFSTLAQHAGLKLTALPVLSKQRVPAALDELQKRGVEVVFIPPDQLSQQYAKLLAEMGKKRRFVVVNGNPRIESTGAVLSVTLNYEALGERAAHLAQRLLKGEKPGGIPIVQASPAHVEVDESLLNLWAGYPPEKR
jgi:putative tryptophan/tyrosine transport system substrate-binding protein